MKHSQGFTLVEIIAALVITGVVAGLTAMFMSTGISGYLTAQRNAEASLKSHVALTRLSQEIKQTANATAPSATSLEFTVRLENGNPEDRAVTFNTAGCANAICMEDVTNNITGVLIDEVASFQVTVNTVDLDADGDADDVGSIDVQFTLDSVPTVFQNRVFPRNQDLIMQTP